MCCINNYTMYQVSLNFENSTEQGLFGVLVQLGFYKIKKDS